MKCEFEVRGDVQVCIRCKRELPARIPNPLIGCRAHSKPGIITRGANFSRATAKWTAAGRPTRPPSEVERIFAICKACDHYDPSTSTCDLCGCPVKRQGLRNKIRMATEGCPDQPPRWLPAWPVARSTIDDVTIGITAFKRPESLERLVKSIHQHYPTARIVVADNGDERANVDVHSYLSLPFDCGLSAARNALIDTLETPYLLLCEDDFEFTAETKLEPLLEILDADATVGLVGGIVRNENGREPWQFDFEQFRDTLYCVPPRRAPRVTPAATAYTYCDLRPNWFLARRKLLQDCRWDDDLKLQEHREWFHRLWKLQQWRVAHTDATSIKHNSERDGQYAAYRQRRFFQDALARMGVVGCEVDYSGLPSNALDKPNVIILGVGHSGTTILTRMYEAEGWNLGPADKEYAEHPEIRSLSRDARTTGQLDRDAARAALESLPQPWCVKIPGFVHTLHLWTPVLAEMGLRPDLIWIVRDPDAVRASYVRRGTRPEVVEPRFAAAREQFDRWPWHKCRRDYEAIGKAVGLFDVQRAGVAGAT